MKPLMLALLDMLVFFVAMIPLGWWLGTRISETTRELVKRGVVAIWLIVSTSIGLMALVSSIRSILRLLA